MAILIQLNDGVATNKFPINKPLFQIGRATYNDICIDDPLVSKEHAVLEVMEVPDQPGNVEYFIKDLDSTNKTFVNEKKISRAKLNDNDIIRIGLSNFKLTLDQQEDYNKTTKLHKSWIPGVYFTK